jgi:hypothetical protein
MDIRNYEGGVRLGWEVPFFPINHFFPHMDEVWSSFYFNLGHFSTGLFFVLNLDQIIRM